MSTITAATKPFNTILHDSDTFAYIEQEYVRQRDGLELIASENFVSKQVMEAVGSVLTNKYAEGYPNKRWYGGCEVIDHVEKLAIDRAKELFDAQWVNVQPHSGSSANLAAYYALLQHGDIVLGMDLSQGGHLTHGSPVNFSGLNYNIVAYGVDKNTEYIDYDAVLAIAKEHKPKMIIAGASAYSRILDFAAFRRIADEVGAYLMVDMAHIAGLVAGGVHPSPLPHAHVVTTTTHKTLRGPRAGLILSNDLEIGAKVDKMVFPGTQGGPLEHVIAGKAVAFFEALQPEFKSYAQQIIKNAKALAEAFQKRAYRVVSGGTDNHVFLVDVMSSLKISGKKAQSLLDKVHITVNKNTIPFDTKSPFVTSGIRIGTPAITTRGLTESEMPKIAELIDRSLKGEPEEIIKVEVLDLIQRFPMPS